MARAGGSSSADGTVVRVSADGTEERPPRSSLQCIVTSLNPFHRLQPYHPALTRGSCTPRRASPPGRHVCARKLRAHILLRLKRAPQPARDGAI